MDLGEVVFAGAAAQARALAAGEITAPALLEAHLERIDRLDPKLNAFRVVRREPARAEARAAQERIDAGERAPLLGVPIAIKDDIDVAGEVTAWGTAAHGAAKEADAEVVRRLREAGVVVIGKTNVPEMTLWPFTESTTFGDTTNPWDISRTPGGSSGGTAAAVAAGLVPIGVGSDGGGSIRTPATWCGLFGIKPQRDRVPLAPHLDAWQGLSVNGPLTRTVEDAALFLDVTSTLPVPEGGFVAAAARPPGRLRIAVSTKVPPGPRAQVGAAEQDAVAEAVALLRELGHDVVERDPRYPMVAVGLNVVARYLRGVDDDVQTMPHPERLEARTRSIARLGRLVSDGRMAKIRAREAAFASTINAVFDEADVLLLPSTAKGPFPVGAFRGRGAIRTMVGMSGHIPFHAVWNATGQPAAAVPWGLDHDGLPLAVQLVGRPSDEATLLSLSAQIESARPWAHRRPSVA